MRTVRRNVRRAIRAVSRVFIGVARFFSRLGWRLILVVLGIAVGLEVGAGLFAQVYTKGPYQFLPLPLPLMALLVIGVDMGLSALRKRLYAGFLLSFIIAVAETAMTVMAIHITLTRFTVPQITTYILLTFAAYQVFLAWRRGVLGKRIRKPKKTGLGHGH